MRGCSCTCCMLQPIQPCHCFGRHCVCPSDDLPALDANCSVPGRVVMTMDSCVKPGSPSCFLKYHRSILVEYPVSPNDLAVSAIYEVSLQGAAGRERGRGLRAGRTVVRRGWVGEGEGGLPAAAVAAVSADSTAPFGQIPDRDMTTSNLTTTHPGSAAPLSPPPHACPLAQPPRDPLPPLPGAGRFQRIGRAGVDGCGEFMPGDWRAPRSRGGGISPLEGSLCYYDQD